MKIKKPAIAQTYIIPKAFVRPDFSNELGKYIEKFTYAVIEDWENFCIDSLYKEYQKYGITRVLIINRDEFKSFLLWALPLYNRHKKGE